MSDVSHPELIRAFDLIERDDLDQARTILDTYLETHQTDVDAWWLYAHAVTDPMDAQEALRHVVQLDPGYPGARALLNESEQALIPKPAAGITRLTPRPTPIGSDNTIPDFLNQLDDEETLDEDEFDEFDDEELGETAQRPPRRTLFIIAAALITVLMIGVVIILLNSRKQGTTVTTTPTTVANNPTIAPTLTVEAVPTSEVTTPEVGDSEDFADIYTALDGFIVVDNSAGVEATSLGQTFLISVCNDPSGNLVKTTMDVIDKIAAQSSALAGSADYIGARILNCQRDNLLLLTLAASMTDAQAYADGSLSATDFQTKLQPIKN